MAARRAVAGSCVASTSHWAKAGNPASSRYMPRSAGSPGVDVVGPADVRRDDRALGPLERERRAVALGLEDEAEQVAVAAELGAQRRGGDAEGPPVAQQQVRRADRPGGHHDPPGREQPRAQLVGVGPVALALGSVHDELDLEARPLDPRRSAVTSERTEITAPAWAAAERYVWSSVFLAPSLHPTSHSPHSRHVRRARAGVAEDARVVVGPQRLAGVERAVGAEEADGQRRLVERVLASPISAAADRIAASFGTSAPSGTVCTSRNDSTAP